MAELVATDLPAAAVIATAENELTELLQLAECRFEAPPYTSDLPWLERSGAVAGTRHVFTPDGFELPIGGVQLPVLARGRPVGRFLLVPTPGVGLSLERRVVAVALADQVGWLMGSSASDRHPTDSPAASGVEAVAHAGLGDEVARPGRVGLELAPQVGQVDPQVVASPRRTPGPTPPGAAGAG